VTPDRLQERTVSDEKDTVSDEKDTVSDDVDDTATEHVDDTTSSEPPAPTTRSWSRSELVRMLLLAAAVLLAVSGSAAWWQAAHDESIDAARARDAMLVQARQGIETMNTLDYRSVEKGIDAWASVTTGTLHDQLAAVSAEDRQLLEDQAKITTGRVVDAAVTDLDDKTGTVIAAVEVTVRDGKDGAADPTVKRNRFSADLVRVGGTWKLENLQQVAVDLS
jgi:Mce-associated membrane protein